MTVVHATAAPAGIMLRPGCPDDQGYLTTTWLRSMEHAPANRRLGRSRFFREQGAIIDRLLDRDDVKIVVAHPLGRASRVHGWICYTPLRFRPPLLHYVYVRLREHGVDGALVRGRGLARHLLSAAGLAPGLTTTITYTFPGPGIGLLHALYRSVVYYPADEFLR